MRGVTETPVHEAAEPAPAKPSRVLWGEWDISPTFT